MISLFYWQDVPMKTSILQVGERKTVSASLDQCTHGCHVASLLQLCRIERLLHCFIIHCKRQPSFFGLKFHLNHVSRSVASLEVTAVLVRAISEFSSRVIGISILEVGEGFFDIGDF